MGWRLGVHKFLLEAEKNHGRVHVLYDLNIKVTIYCQPSFKPSNREFVDS